MSHMVWIYNDDPAKGGKLQLVQTVPAAAAFMKIAPSSLRSYLDLDGYCRVDDPVVLWAKWGGHVVVFGPTPKRCDICKGPFESVMYDAKTIPGPWGNLCQGCFITHGLGLGTGLGQRYELQTDGSFIKTEG